ncbi:MAG: response regulator [Ketobacteraceae bacterium]|nr:response regulator [Ketobacteraceae bacterium]
MSYQILIVEDEPKLSQSMSEYFSGIGYRTKIIDNGNKAAAWVRENEPALILLDLMLPGKDGVAVCQEIRTFSQVPIIMVTAKTEEVDRLIGLEIGADDYVCKPFSLRELAARVKAVLRRFEYVPEAVSGRGLTLDKSSSTIQFQGKQVELTAIEYNIMEKLVRHPGRIFKRDELIDVAYTDGRIVNDRTVDSHMKKIRKKLGQVAPDQKFVHSIYGAGYKFEP